LKWISQLIDRDKMAWKVDVINEYFQPYDVDHILGIRLPLSPVEDFIAWHHEKNGHFHSQERIQACNGGKMVFFRKLAIHV